MCIIIGISVHKGVGHYSGHMDLQAISKLIVAFNTLWSVLVGITKASILAQYLRIFDGRRTRTNCYTLLFLLLPATSWGIFGGIFLCTPTAKLWNPSLPGHCRNAQTYWSSVAAIDIFLDFWTLLLPMPSITSLRLPRKQKLATMFAFLLGFVVCVVGVARLATVIASAERGDFVISGIWAIIWSAVEGNISIICASFLSLKALVTKLFPRLLLPDVGGGPVAEPVDGTLPQLMAEREGIHHHDGACWLSGDSRAVTLGHCSGSSSLFQEAGKLEGSDGVLPPCSTRVPPAGMPPNTDARSRPSKHRPADSRGEVVDFFQMLREDAAREREGTLQ